MVVRSKVSRFYCELPVRGCAQFCAHPRSKIMADKSSRPHVRLGFWSLSRMC
jgi:hypothetical protein